MTTVYLVYTGAADYTLRKHADTPVDLLVSYLELATFEKNRHHYNVRQWMMDSGAFSVWKSGATVDLSAYIQTCLHSDADEVVALDVIGDWDASVVNTLKMWDAGVDAMPVLHQRDPAHAVEWCKNLPATKKIGVSPKHAGGLEWLRNTFGWLWPRKMHGFGVASWKAVTSGPLHSCDASSWCFAPAAYGHYAGYSGKQEWLRCRGIKDYWVEVAEHQKRARWAASRWKKELALLETLE